MARDSDEEKVRAETDELSALGPEPAGPPAQVEEELMDESALAALSNAHRRANGPKTVEATAIASDATKRPGPARQWWLAMAIGIGLGAAVSALVFSQRSQPAAPLTAANEAQPAPEPALAASHEDAVPAVATPLPSEVAANPPSAPAIAVREQPPAAAGPTHAAPPTPSSAHVAASHTPASIEATPDTSTKTAPAPPKAAPDSEEARLAAAAVRTGSESPMDAVLDDAFTQGQQHTAQARAARNAAAAVPVAPSRDDVIKTMTVLVPAIRGCAQGESGLATAGMVVSNDGKVQSVNVTGQPFEGTASGRCMEGVVRRARFARFQQPSFRVQFPFSLQ